MDVPSLLAALGDYGFSDTTTTRKMDKINDVIWDVCSREAWPFLEVSTTLNFDGTNANPSNWPTNVGQVVDVVDTINGTRVQPVRIDELRAAYSTLLGQKGLPLFYYFLANQLFIYPIPPSTQTLLMIYTLVPTALNSASLETDIIIPPRWHSVILHGVLAQLYDMEDDPELANRAEMRFENKINNMRYQAYIRQVDESDTIQIVDYEDLFD